MSIRPKKIQKNNIALKAACLMTAVLLCLAALPIFAEERREEDVPSSLQIEGAAFSSMPQISATSAILIEAESGRVIAEKNADQRMPMASTTKIMTALTAIENCDVKKTISVPSAAVGIEGSSIYLYEGEQLTVEDLLYAMLLESANDAAAAIAIAIGGSIEGFAEMMNARAKALGLENTHFENPHGLDSPEHYTTARELALISAAAMKNETFQKIVSTYKITIPLNQTEGVRLLINHNKMLKSYSGAVGIKTGYTKKSGRCLVSAAEKDGVKLIAVTLNAPDDWQDHTKMLDLGFSILESRTLCEVNEFKRVQPIIGGDYDSVILTNTTSCAVVLPRSAPEIKCRLELERFTYAPLKEGETVGHLVYTLDGEILAKVPICATSSVTKASYRLGLWERLCAFLKK